MEQQGLVPNAIAYNAVISACEKGTLPERALEVFASMGQQGVMATVVSYSALISACEKGERSE